MAQSKYTNAPWRILPALFLLLTGCASSTKFYRAVEDDLGAGRHTEAIEGIIAHREVYGDKSDVLYNMDLGLLYHYAGMSDSSSAHLLAAEREIENLYTKSVSLAALSIILNDNILPYDGEDFERVLLNVFLALNYAEQGLPDEALVEARKVDLKMREFIRKYEGKNTYQEDAFARYLAGALYESAGELTDAFIEYQKADEAYRTYARIYGTKAPSFLLDDLARTARQLGFSEESEKYVKLGGTDTVAPSGTRGSIIVVAYSGKSPVKTEVRTNVSIGDSAGVIHTFQIALPKFTPRMTNERTYQVEVRKSDDSGLVTITRTSIAENITAIAGQSLDDRLALIYLKSGGRAVLKFLAAEKAKSKLREKNENLLMNLLSSIAVDLAVGATEQADIRSWRTLPAQIQLARLELPEGSYDVSLESSDRGFGIPAHRARVKSGKITFLIVDDIR
jgi:uncharacterized protein